VTRLLDRHDSNHGGGKKFIFFPVRPHWLWSPNSLQFSGCRSPLPWE
jgi:hypothetical protein